MTKVVRVGQPVIWAGVTVGPGDVVDVPADVAAGLLLESSWTKQAAVGGRKSQEAKS